MRPRHSVEFARPLLGAGRTGFGCDTFFLMMPAAASLPPKPKAIATPGPTVAKTSIASAGDIVLARRRGRDLALALGFSSTDSTLVATAISELARNIVLYASSGTVRVETARDGGRTGLAIVASDDGPGIAHVQRAMIGGYSTSGGLGLGLSGVKRIMDEVHVRSQTGAGTTVVAKKWLDRIPLGARKDLLALSGDPVAARPRFVSTAWLNCEGADAGPTRPDRL